MCFFATLCPEHTRNLVALLNASLYLSNKVFTVEHDASLIVLIDIMGTRSSRTVGFMSSVRNSLLLVRKEISATDLLYTCSNSIKTSSYFEFYFLTFAHSKK